MKCKDIKRKISDYIDGNISNSDKKAFEEHISTCNECYSLINDLLTLKREVNKIRIPSPSLFVFERVKARLQERVFPKALVFKLAFATSLSLFLVFTFSFHFIGKGREEYAKKYIKDLYIIQEKSSGYQLPVYNVENNYVVSTGRSGTF